MMSAGVVGGVATGESGTTITGTSYGAREACDISPMRLRQVKTRLVFTSYFRATTETDAPGASDAATISHLSASGHNLCRRLTRKLVSIISIVDTS